MKRILLFLGLMALLVGQSWGYGIVNNSGTSSEDSVCVNVLCPDSLCQPVKCDSFYVVVFKSGTNTVVFRDSGLIAMTGMDSTVIGGRTTYYYHRATEDIDGDGLAGQYSGQLISVTVTENLSFISPFTFQVVSQELDDQLTTINTNLDATISSRGVSDLTEDSNIGVDLDDVTGTLSDAEIATIGVNVISADANAKILGDSLGALMGDVDNIVTYVDTEVAEILDNIQYIGIYWGACDDCYQIMYPRDGSPNKDSIIVIDPSLAPDSLVAKVEYIHNNTASVVDTTYFYIAPWW